MENNKKIKYLNLAITVLIALVLAVVVFFGYKTLFVDQTKPKNNLDTVTIQEDKYNQIVNPVNYGSPITTEEGFGRANPFAPYK